MRAGRRFVRDESGMTMGLAVIMVVLIGVMGAGLLTFVSQDLNSVIEVNRGQRAFEMADTGVAAARRQLESGVSVPTKYDGLDMDDVQWSASKTNADSDCPSGTTHGMCLNNLDGASGTTDRVNVTIQHRSATDDFKVISTGEYSNARRKIEAILVMTAGAGGTPAFYTKSDIKIQKRVTINGVSLFSESNIRLEDLKPTMTPASFKATYEGSPSEDILNIDHTKADELGDWNIPPWNTVGRTGLTGYPSPYNSNSVAFDRVGLAAEGKICGSSSCQSDSPSVADGVYGYDSTTGTKGNNLRFAEKTNCSTGVAEPTRSPNGTTCTTPAQNIITYPFERTVPNAAQLKTAADNYPSPSAPANADKYYVGSSPPWGTLFDAASKDDPKVVFIDAQGSGVTFNNSTVLNNYGVLVVWCGKLTMESDFKGVIITMHGNELPGGSTCAEDKGGFVNKGRALTGFAYAEGNVGGSQGIELQENSVLNPLTGPGRNELLGYSFGGGGTSSVEIQAWRELYQ